jgi:hypothetical protein
VAETLGLEAPLTMDPLSISASAIAVATVASQIVKNLIRVKSLIGSRDGMLALANEVADLELVLLKIGSATEAVSNGPTSEMLSLSGSIASASEKLNELDASIESCTGQKSSTNIRRRIKQWLKEPHTLERLQQELRDIRCKISLELGVVS